MNLVNEINLNNHTECAPAEAHKRSKPCTANDPSSTGVGAETLRAKHDKQPLVPNAQSEVLGAAEGEPPAPARKSVPAKVPETSRPCNANDLATRVETNARRADTEASAQTSVSNERRDAGDEAPAARLEELTVTAKALVSFCSGDMLTATVLLAGELKTAHLDSCASHCFISTEMSSQLTAKGFPRVRSPVCFEVTQGKPLCDTDQVHLLPLTMIREDGTQCTWENCMFLVADAGAPIILCYTLLRLGGILAYEPPSGYESALEHCRLGYTASVRGERQQSTTLTAANLRGGPYYQSPTLVPATADERQRHGNCLRTDARIENLNTENGFELEVKIFSEQFVHECRKNHDRDEPENSVIGTETQCQTASLENRYHVLGVPGIVLRTTTAPEAPKKDTPLPKRRKGDTDMLTPENPYGRNPPLPEEVMEAMRHLKMLSNPATCPVYTEQQMEEIHQRFQKDRPKWANCLTMVHTTQVNDKETEQFLFDLMDKPEYQESIFSHHMKECCDLGEYELNQKPGQDLWHPSQHKKFKNPATIKIVDDWLDFLLDNNKARESKATHPAMVTIIQKDGKDPRVCVDYRNRNARTEVPIFPMPDVADFLDDNSGFKYYCSFDMAKMFNQFRIKEAHKHLAAFITHRGVYEPNVVLFGLSGGPQHAVREVGGAMAKDPLTNGIKFTEWAVEQNAKGVLPPYDICPSTKVVKGSRLKPFIDDVTIPSNHTEGMKKMVEYFFEFCLKHHLILSRKKAQIMKKHLRMLGFVVSEQGKHLDPHRILSLLEAEKPRSKETLHALLSSYTFIRMFIPNFASVATPLYEATKGIVWKGPLSGKAQGTRLVDPDFAWTPEMTRAYEQLRAALLEAPILSKVDWKYPLFLSVDACIRGEGWVLWQLIETTDGANVAVAIKFGSKKYNDSESNWETTRQEASAIRNALTDVYDFVFGQHFYVFSDHLNLRFMHNSVNRAVLRMRDFLSQFNMDVIHCPGIWNNADGVSRIEHANLPVGLAQNLNSATTARLDGVSTPVSTGTCVANDFQTEGSVRDIYEYTEHRSDKPHQTAKTFRTQVHVCVPTCCLLCDVTNQQYNMEEPLYYNEEEVVTGNVQVLPEKDDNTSLDSVESTEISKLWSKRSEVPFEQLQEEARVWTSKATVLLSKTRIPEPIDRLSLREDLDDQENVDWCGMIDRESVALKPVRPGCFQSSNVTPDSNLLHYQHSPTKKRVTFWDNPDVVLTPKIIYEAVDEGTQTTPADFRVAMIRTPLTEDFKAIHNNESGHHGFDHSYRKLLKRCGSRWANERGEATKVKSLLKEYIDSCPICQKVRGLKDKVKAKHSFIVSRPFLEVSYDFIIFKRPDKNGNRYIVVAIDNFLKLVEIKPIANRDAETVAKFLLEIGARYGPAARLRYDREKAFTGLLISRLNENRGIEGKPCIPYHPQANSVCERQNGIIMEHLNALILGCKLGPETKLGWSDLTPFVFSIVNNTPKNPLGISPLSMLYGVFANYDQPLLSTHQANTPGDTSNPVDYVESLMAWQTQLLDITEQIQSDHFAKLEKRLNSPSNKSRRFNVGDFVLQLKKATKISGKPGTRWVGPFLVMERRDNDPTHPVLDLMNLTDMTVKEASIEDCRIFNTTWFDEEHLIPELIKMSAIDENEYVVESILSHKPTGARSKTPISKYLFEVKWQDFDETTWEPYSGLKDLEPFERYSILHPELNIPPTT